LKGDESIAAQAEGNVLHHRRTTLLKHTLIGAALFSSLAFAAPTPAPAPHQARPVAMPPPPAVTYHQAAPDSWGRGDSRSDSMRDSARDSMRASRLLGEFETAAARRDGRAMRAVDGRFAALIDQELFEARAQLDRPGPKYGRVDPAVARAQRTVEQLLSLERQLGRLQGRIDRGAVAQKRSLYTQAVAIAERDVRFDGRGRQS